MKRIERCKATETDPIFPGDSIGFSFDDPLREFIA
jgi:hypothetical protein